MSKKLGVIGFGNMGGAIVKGLINKGQLQADDIIVYDVFSPALQAATELGLQAATSESEVLEQAEFVLLAVKPNAAKAALEAAGKQPTQSPKALLSVVAGVEDATLTQWLGRDVRVLRIMPNTPALVGAGAFGFADNTTLRAEEQQLVEKWFAAIGLVEWVSPHLMAAVTGLSGGAPAYTAMYIEALADGGVLQGLKRDVAYRLAAQTVLGTAKMILELGMHPGALKDGVCSPAGTTIEGVAELEKGGMRYAVIQAVNSSSEKSKRLV